MFPRSRTHHASNTPNVDGKTPITSTDDSFRRAILPRLYIFGEVFIYRRGITKIGDLNDDGRLRAT